MQLSGNHAKSAEELATVTYIFREITNY